MLTRLVSTIVLVVGLSVSAYAAERENLQIFREVQREVLRYPHFTIFDSVSAQVEDGVVILTGKVTMPYKRNDIERRVSRLGGIDEVQNRIEVLPVSQFDDELRYRIARAIYSNAHFAGYGSMVNPPIHIIVERGRVTLEGVVNSNVGRMVARSLASGFGVCSLQSSLKTDAEGKAELEKL